MATSYKLKRKLYAAEDHTGSGLLLGGTAALVGGFAAAKKGMLGNTLAKGANKAWASAGKAIGSKKMIDSGAMGYGNASANQFKTDFVKRYGNTKTLTDAQVNKQATKYADRIRKANGEAATLSPKATTAKKAAESTASNRAARKAELEAKRAAKTQAAAADTSREAAKKAELEAKRAAQKAAEQKQANLTKDLTPTQMDAYRTARKSGDFASNAEALSWAKGFSSILEGIRWK